MKRCHNSIFIRMFVMFILLFIPIYIMFASVYTTSLKLIKKEILQLTESQTDNFLRELENEIWRIKSLLYQIVLNDKDIQMLASIPELDGNFGKTVAINNVKNILKIISYSSSYIEDVRIHFPNLNRTISVNSDYDEMHEEYEKVPRYSNDSILQYIDNCIIISTSDVVKIDNQPRFTIVIELSHIQIKNKLKELDYLDSGWTVLKNTDLGLIIGTKSNQYIYNKMNEDIALATHSTISVNGEKYLLTQTSHIKNEL